MVSTKERNMVRVLLGRKDTNIIPDDDIDVFIDAATDEDRSDGDAMCVALLAASKIAQSNLWKTVTSNADGTNIATADTFKDQLESRLVRLDRARMQINNAVYDEFGVEMI